MQRREAAHWRVRAPRRIQHRLMSEELTSPLGSLAYDPAPESIAIAQLRPSYGLFIDGEFTDPASHESFDDAQPGERGRRSRSVAQASSARTSNARSPRPGAPTTRCGRKTTGAERAKYLFRIARTHSGARSRTRRRRDPRQRQGRFASRATSTFRSLPPTSSTTPAGRTSSTTPASGRVPSLWASRVRSSRGTFRC